VINAVQAILSLAVVLGVLVFVHELGHFLAAKWAGIRVFRFALGMGKPIKKLSFTLGHTEYAVCWLPLGGYVKMASREEMAGDALEGGTAPTEEVPPEETFEAKPVWKRMVVILAGVAFNVLFAWLVYSLVLLGAGQPTFPITTVGMVVDSILPPGAESLTQLQPGDRILRVAGREVETWGDIQEGIRQGAADTIVIEVEGKPPIGVPLHRDALTERFRASEGLLPWLPPVLGPIAPGRPAARAGIQAGDTVVALDGEPVEQWYTLQQALTARPGETVRLTLGRASGRTEVTLTTDAEVAEGAAPDVRVGRIGVQVGGVDPVFRPLGFGEAFSEGARLTASTSTLIVRVLRGMLTGRVSARELGGPIAIAQGAAQTARAGLADFFMFMGLISVNLAVVNLLPIPVLDGGQFLFLLGEAVRRRPLSLRLRQQLTTVGLMVVVLLMVLALSNDILRLFGL